MGIGYDVAVPAAGDAVTLGLRWLFVGAALCRDRAAKRPQGFSNSAQIAGAALQPYRDTRPLLQDSAQQPQHFLSSPRIITRLPSPGKSASHVYPIETAAKETGDDPGAAG
ncbi:hypothetical protein CXG45_13050 [Pseudomonas plecoglossicida]|uniref:Uncharacterized protein n=1 Tax=Pseudomonas plecoglossicida TaxID=70775 RepID=A0ABX4U6F8_PSEDL|nr:hypothetical protein CXG44_10510 [Pseudomonas plecoglossicida]PLU92998.1 hypothetical protein CXG45_13050 [Pseudomonas plecoglossicida]PLV02463.1 hypothetical protein CXG48_15995 [Pseudomonas plecoglossicida]PLV16703.1 hypothetical protein CXG47_00700 [Pseudomonas plecoglossicida]